MWPGGPDCPAAEPSASTLNRCGSSATDRIWIEFSPRAVRGGQLPCSPLWRQVNVASLRRTGQCPREVASYFQLSESRLVDMGAGQAFFHVFTPPVRLVLVGATHIGQVLADLAVRIGYDVVIIDPRTAFASQERIGEITALTDWPEVSLKALGLDTRTAVVTLTHAAALDDEALTAALRSDCLYIGALGSTRTHAKRLERLRAAGFGVSEVARIRAPVGLAIGAKGPAEIAVSILAEIVKVARGAV